MSLDRKCEETQKGEMRSFDSASPHSVNNANIEISLFS